MKFFTRPLHYYILIFVFFTIDLFAQNDFQPGYVLTLDKDTLYGQINLQAIARMCRACVFRSDKNAESVEYLPDEITPIQIPAFPSKNRILTFRRNKRQRSCIKPLTRCLRTSE